MEYPGAATGAVAGLGVPPPVIVPPFGANAGPVVAAETRGTTAVPPCASVTSGTEFPAETVGGTEASPFASEFSPLRVERDTILLV